MSCSARFKKGVVALEAYALDGGAWREIGRFAGGALGSLPPFEAVTISLDDLWALT